jgi:hypothetical protein
VSKLRVDASFLRFAWQIVARQPWLIISTISKQLGDGRKSACRFQAPLGLSCLTTFIAFGNYHLTTIIMRCDGHFASAILRVRWVRKPLRLNPWQPRPPRPRQTY